jgi:survival of motor neuron protein-interacting protein 1
MDAMEYMAAVVQQANAMPDVFVAEAASTEEPQDRPVHVPIDGSAASLSYLVSEKTSIVSPPTAEYAPPSRAWVDTTLSSFSELRSYLDRCHKEGVGGKGTERMAVPLLRDRSGWHVFCVGVNEAQGNAGSYFDDESDESDDDAACQWKQNVPPEGHYPSVRLLLQMDQVMIRRVLSHLAHYVQDGWSPSSKQRSTWFFALLARLERPIHRDDAATLYGLLKYLTLWRAKVDVSDINRNELARINTLIAVVGLYFEQGGGYSNVMGQSLR